MDQSNGILSVIAEFVNSNPLLVIVFFVLSLLANVAQLVSYVSQRRFQGAYDEALETWRRNLEGKYSEEQIKLLEKELLELKRQIDSEVPRLARRTYLGNQLKELEDDIGHTYLKYKNVLNELNSLSQTTVLAVGLEQAIERDIAPEYSRRQQQQRISQFLLTSTFALLSVIALVLLFSVIPLDERVTLGIDTIRDYPLRWIIGFLGVVITVYVLWFIILRKRLAVWMKNKSKWLPVLIFVSMILSFFSFSILEFLASSWVGDCGYYRYPSCTRLLDWPPRVAGVAIYVSPIAVFTITFAYWILSTLEYRRRKNAPLLAEMESESEPE